MNTVKLALIVAVLIFIAMAIGSTKAATTGGDVTVHATSSDQPISEVHVRILGGDSSVSLSSDTDDNGQCVFTDVPVSSTAYRVTVSHPAYSADTQNLTVSSISSYSVDFALTSLPESYQPGTNPVSACGAVIFAAAGVISFMFLVRMKRSEN